MGHKLSMIRLTLDRKVLEHFAAQAEELGLRPEVMLAIIIGERYKKERANAKPTGDKSE